MNRILVYISIIMFVAIGFGQETERNIFDPTSLHAWARETQETFKVHSISESLEIKRIQDSLDIGREGIASRGFVFRIQLGQTNDYQKALTIETSANELFAKNIELVFDSPYYKVRVGEFESREEAEEFKLIAREKGYRGAWIVRTEVWKKKKR